MSNQHVKKISPSSSVTVSLHLCFTLFVLDRFFELFDKYGGYKSGKLKLKKPKQLQVTGLS